MATRMERYYQNEQEDFKRTDKNADLYREIYEDKKYDNIETLATLDVGKEIDLDDLKALLKERNEADKRYLVKPRQELKEVEQDMIDTSVYDIRELMDKAKNDQKDDVKLRKLAETQAFTLQELISQKDYSNKTTIDKEDVKDLIDTICNTNLLKGDDGLGLLDDLKSTGNTMISPNIKKILDEAKEEERTTEEIDKSFYTSSLGFKQTDFDSMEDDEDLESSNKLTTWFLVILSLIFLAAIIYIIIKYDVI